MEEEISLSELFSILKKRMAMIISLGLIGLILAAVFTFFIALPKYSATTQILVNRTTESAEGMQLNDITTNVQMINTYKDIIKGPVILNEVSEKVQGDLSAKELAGKIEISAQDNSQVFSLIVTSEDPFIASEIANQVANTFQNEIGNIMKVENVTIISEAIPTSDQISPNNLLNIIIGLVVGLMLGIVGTFLLEFMDTTVHDEQFIIKDLNWTSLGSVSEMSSAELASKIEAPKQTVLRRNQSRV